MQPPRTLTNAWFEQLFDTRAWDIVARVLFVVAYAFALRIALPRSLDVWQPRTADGWLWLEMATRTLGVINISLPMLIVVVRYRPVARIHGLMPKVVALAVVLADVIHLASVSSASAGDHVDLQRDFLVVGGSLTVWTWLHLGRSFSLMAEARKLSTSGPYRLVRHPLYLFEQMSVVAVCILYASPVATLILAVQIACQLQRIANEERLLSQTFPEYVAYQKTTWKLIPRVDQTSRPRFVPAPRTLRQLVPGITIG